MEVISSRSALLSNFEVYQLLKEQQEEQAQINQRQETEDAASEGKLGALSIRQADRKANAPAENQLQIQTKTLTHLMAGPHPTLRQDDASTKALLQGLRKFDLTKSEKLMIVNLAPTTNVELYTIVEELEDRLADQIDEILELVTKSLRSPSTPIVHQTPTVPNGTSHHPVNGVDHGIQNGFVGDWVGEEQVYYDEEAYGGHDDLVDEMDED